MRLDLENSRGNDELSDFAQLGSESVRKEKIPGRARALSGKLDEHAVIELEPALTCCGCDARTIICSGLPLLDGPPVFDAKGAASISPAGSTIASRPGALRRWYDAIRHHAGRQ